MNEPKEVFKDLRVIGLTPARIACIIFGASEEIVALLACLARWGESELVKRLTNADFEVYKNLEVGKPSMGGEPALPVHFVQRHHATLCDRYGVRRPYAERKEEEGPNHQEWLEFAPSLLPFVGVLEEAVREVTNNR